MHVAVTPVNSQASAVKSTKNPNGLLASIVAGKPWKEGMEPLTRAFVDPANSEFREFALTVLKKFTSTQETERAWAASHLNVNAQNKDFQSNARLLFSHLNIIDKFLAATPTQNFSAELQAVVLELASVNRQIEQAKTDKTSTEVLDKQKAELDNQQKQLEKRISYIKKHEEAFFQALENIPNPERRHQIETSILYVKTIVTVPEKFMEAVLEKLTHTKKSPELQDAGGKVVKSETVAVRSSAERELDSLATPSTKSWFSPKFLRKLQTFFSTGKKLTNEQDQQKASTLHNSFFVSAHVVHQRHFSESRFLEASRRELRGVRSLSDRTNILLEQAAFCDDLLKFIDTETHNKTPQDNVFRSVSEPTLTVKEIQELHRAEERLLSAKRVLLTRAAHYQLKELLELEAKALKEKENLEKAAKKAQKQTKNQQKQEAANRAHVLAQAAHASAMEAVKESESRLNTTLDSLLTISHPDHKTINLYDKLVFFKKHFVGNPLRGMILPLANQHISLYVPKASAVEVFTQMSFNAAGVSRSTTEMNTFAESSPTTQMVARMHRFFSWFSSSSTTGVNVKKPTTLKNVFTYSAGSMEVTVVKDHQKSFWTTLGNMVDYIGDLASKGWHKLRRNPQTFQSKPPLEVTSTARKVWDCVKWAVLTPIKSVLYNLVLFPLNAVFDAIKYEVDNFATKGFITSILDKLEKTKHATTIDTVAAYGKVTLAAVGGFIAGAVRACLHTVGNCIHYSWPIRVAVRYPVFIVGGLVIAINDKIKAPAGEGHLLADCARAVLAGPVFATTAAITQPVQELLTDAGSVRKGWVTQAKVDEQRASRTSTVTRKTTIRRNTSLESVTSSSTAAKEMDILRRASSPISLLQQQDDDLQRRGSNSSDSVSAVLPSVSESEEEHGIQTGKGGPAPLPPLPALVAQTAHIDGKPPLHQRRGSHLAIKTNIRTVADGATSRTHTPIGSSATPSTGGLNTLSSDEDTSPLGKSVRSQLPAQDDITV